MNSVCKMTLTQIELAKVVAQASSLSERIRDKLFKIDPTPISEQQFSDERLNRWCQVVAQGNWEKFQKRLRWDGLEIDKVRPALGEVYFPDNRAFPSWAETLREIIQSASNYIFHDDETTDPSKTSNPQSSIPVDPKNPLPFEDILLPALQVARQKLLTYLGSASLSIEYLPLELLSEQAYLSLERSLLAKLVTLCVKTLDFEFTHSRSLGQSLLSLVIEETQGSKSREAYNAFVQKLLQDGLLSFFQKYPVLGRLLATRIDFWVEATAEFLQRLKADLPEIQQAFNCPIDSKEKVLPGKVIAIKPFLSDPHNRGRSVIALTFDSGLKLIYKPKNLGLEVAYGQFLDWCNQHNAPLPLKVLKVLNFQGYGWMEYVEQQPCKDEAAAQRFYRRAGMLLCLLSALGATDCHHENLVASGEHLVLVDMETVMHHEARLMEESPEVAEVKAHTSQQFLNSILSTGLLPCWRFSEDNHVAYDISGLGSADPQQSSGCIWQWNSVNTDDMHLAYETKTLPVRANVPTLNGSALSPNDYLEEIVSGFKQMCYFLIEQRERLLVADGPLTALQAQQVRFIFRNTQVYGVLLQNTLVPSLLRNGVDRSIELDVLSRAFLWAQDKPKCWTILSSELRAMEQLDIPYFGASAASDNLTVGLEQPIEQYSKQPSYDQIIVQLQTLNDSDLAQYVEIIRGAFYARVARAHDEIEQPLAPNIALRSIDFSQINPLTSEELLQEAQMIAREIQNRAICVVDSSISWIGLGYVPSARRFQSQFLGVNFYDGNGGIALFLAALDHITGDSQYRNLTLGALRSLREFLQTSDADRQSVAEHIGIGGAIGLGSIIYCLVRIGQFLQEDSLLEDAQRFADLIKPELIAVDRSLDIVGGAAGTILGLLALHAETGNQTVLNRAISCGQHLLKQRISVNNSPRSWKNFAQKPLTGFSHGASGIAYALLRLYAVTHDSAYLEAACEGIAYERSVFSTSAANWPDFRSFGKPNDPPEYMVSWCHGAAGIGLARLGSLSILETKEICQDVEVALRTIQKFDLQGVDNLCCGNFGRIEVLLMAAQKLSCLQLRETAQQRAARVVAKAKKTGAYQLFPNLPNSVFSPSFFCGAAGIGYELLRLAYPELLPSVLLWE